MDPRVTGTWRPRLISSTQCRMARACLRWSLEELSEATEVGRTLISQFENDEDIKPESIAKLRSAFEMKGVRFGDSGSLAGAVYRLKTT